MSVISATAMRCKTLADGSLDIVVRVEPADVQAAFALFGVPGRGMALAALKDGSGAVPSTPITPEKTSEVKDSGPMDAALVCKNPKFQEYAEHQGYSLSEAGAAELVRDHCRVSSRGDIRSGTAALVSFGVLMSEFREYQKDPA